MSSARKRELGSDNRPFRQHAMAEPEQLGRTADGVGGDCASFLNELLLLDQAAKILLVDQPACKRLNTALQLQQGEFAGISSNTTGRYLILARNRAMPVARMRR